MLRAAHEDLMVALVNTATMSERVTAVHNSDAADWHANEAETALMMALAPHMVRPDRLAEADDEDRTYGRVFAHPVNRTSRNGVTGFPSMASTEKGDRLYRSMVEGPHRPRHRRPRREPAAPTPLRRARRDDAANDDEDAAMNAMVKPPSVSALQESYARKAYGT